MATAALLSSVIIISLFLLVSANSIIHEACKASRDPSTCESTLSIFSHVSTIPQVIQAALVISTRNIQTGRVMVQNVLESSKGDANITGAAESCLKALSHSGLRLSSSGRTLQQGGSLKDARAWTSAALVNQYGCLSRLKNVDTTSLVGETMSFFNDTLISSTINVLGMFVNYDSFGENTGSWGPPKTERVGFWEPARASRSRFKGGVPRGLKPDVSVCKGGRGCEYETVEEAVKAAPNNTGSGKRFVIWIKAGVYEETVRVPLEKRNVVFLGDGMGKTVITGSRNVGQTGITTSESSTVVGDGFMASNLTITNMAGPNAHQAVAFRSESDRSVVENCEFIGNQDTLYAHSLRQYYKSCIIQGNVDFIFGNSAAFFQDCIILIAPRQLNPEQGEKNTVTAHGRTDPAQSTGFVFQNCLINGTDAYMKLYYSNPKVHQNFLGRPWKEYSRTVFIQCTLEVLISPEGWLPWDGDFALSTLYYGEFGNRGNGSNTSDRVSWSSAIPTERVESYSVENFIQGDRWIPRVSY